MALVRSDRQRASVIAELRLDEQHRALAARHDADAGAVVLHAVARQPLLDELAGGVSTRIGTNSAS